MIPHTKNYHFITVHFGSEAPTRTLIEHLTATVPTKSQIIVVDHGVTPLEISPHPGLMVIRPEKNTGYGAGINLGLGALASRGVNPQDIVVALNNDVVINPPGLTRLIAWWEKQTSPSLASIKMGYVNLVTGRASISASTADPPTWRAIFKIPYLHGSLISASLETFLALQGFPSQNFLYWEDVVLSRRAQELHLPLHVIADTGLTHNDDLARTSSPDQLYYLVRNGAVFLSRFSPRPWRYFWRLVNPLRFVYHTLRSTSEVGPALRDALGNRLGKRV